MSATVRRRARPSRSQGCQAEPSSRSRRSPTSDDLVVRTATAGDAADIARIRGHAWRAAYDHIFTRVQLDSISEAEDTERWRSYLESGLARSQILVAGAGGLMRGFASSGPEAFRADADTGELYAIYVLPDAWGNGVGQALMRETLDRLRAHGFPEAILWVLEDNPRTRRFYELAGWSADGALKEAEWLGAVVREARYRIDLGPAA